MMKGGFYGLRGKQISLTLCALIFGTIFILAWDKTSLLATFLPIQSQLLQSSPDITMAVPTNTTIHSTPDVHAKVDLAGAAQEGEMEPDQEKKIVTDSSPKEVPVKTDVKEATPTEFPVILSGSSEDFEHSHNGETGTTPVEKTPGSVLPMVSETNTPNKEENNNSTKDLEGKTETLSGSLEEQEKTKENHNGETHTESIDKTPDSRTQVGSETTDSIGTENYGNSTMNIKENKACNYAKGKWLEDSSRPLYSGFGCKQWLSGMWACRLTQRTDFSYESFRWHPYNCEMRDFEAPSILKRMQDKTIAFIGDSLGRQQFQSLMCMVTAGEYRADVLNVGREFGLVKARGASRPDGWAYRFPSTNTTILYYWSASLSDLQPIDKNDPATDIAMHLDRPPAFLRKYLHKFDVLVLNTGHHWNRGKLNANRWVMHVGGVPNTNRKIAEITAAKNFTVYSVVKWLDSQLPKHPKLKAFFRTISPRHFFHGDWNTGGSCDNTIPLAGGKEVIQDESSDPVASGAVKGTKVKLLDITALSELRDEGHISRYSIKGTPGVQDCLHWCLPGVPDTWNEVLFAQV